MSDDLDFLMLTRSLEGRRWRRTVAVFGFKRVLRLIIVVLALAALAVFLVLTNTVVIVVTLAVVAMIVFELCRRGIAAEEHSKRSGGNTG